MLMIFAASSAAPNRPDEDPPKRDMTREIEFERTGEYHLGPTGAHGWMHVRYFMTIEARQILITRVDPGTPAHGTLQAGDLILGVAGKPFASDARKELGRAIDEAEKEVNGGVLKLIRWRPVKDANPRRGTKANVELKLTILGSFSDTAPYNCPKSRKLMDAALKALAADKKMGHLEPLAFLASGKQEYIQLVRNYLHEVKWANPDIKIRLDSGGLVVWGCGFRNLILTEYYLLTGDDYVLPAIREYSVKTSMGQAEAGTWGHGFAWTNRNKGKLHGTLGGYGAVNLAGLHCFASLILAKKCGIEHPEIDIAIAKARYFFEQFIDRGSIGYGFHQPSLEQYNNGRNGHSSNGKNGVAALVFSLLNDQRSTRYFSKLVTSTFDEREFGHSGNSFHVFWGQLGTNFGGPHAAAAFHKELRWYNALTRQADGSFAFQPLGGYYGRMTLQPTVAHALACALPLRKLFITGKDSDKGSWLDATETKAAIDAGRWHRADYSKISAGELLDRLDCWSPGGREWIAKGLKHKEGDFVEQLMKMVESSNKNRRAGACTALGHQGEKAARSVSLLAKVLFDEESIVRVAASYALAQIGKPGRQAIPDLMRAILENDEKAFFRPEMQAFSYSLGYDGGPIAPLYFTGILAKTPEGENPLNDLDRSLLYPVVKKLSQSRSGRVRGCGLYVFKYFDRDDVAAMAQVIMDVVKDPPPDFAMFRDSPRAAGIDLLARLKITDGIPLCLDTMDVGEWGSQMRHPNRLEALQTYGNLARSQLPWLHEIRYQLRNDEHKKLLDDTIKVIELDKQKHASISMNELVSKSFQKALGTALNLKERESRCRSLIKKYPENNYWKRAGFRELAVIRGKAK